MKEQAGRIGKVWRKMDLRRVMNSHDQKEVTSHDAEMARSK